MGSKMTNDISPWVKAAAGGVAGLALNWLYDRIGTKWEEEWKQTGNPLAAVEHGDVGLAALIAARHVDILHMNSVKEHAVPFLGGLGASLILMEFRQPDPWGINTPRWNLSSVIHMVLLGTLLVSLSAE